MVSIIVPVYNAEKYLPRCIESILKQSYKDFELILVDDGSNDKSGLICDFYAERDNRIRAIHKENGGVSVARNTGIDRAQGQYISFVDSDDWVEENYLERLLSLMEGTGAQLSIGTFDLRDFRISVYQQHTFDYIDFQNPVFEDCLNFFNGWMPYGPCVKIFERKIIIENNLKFNENIKHGEDTIFVNQYLSCCNKIYITKDVLYHYNRLVENSATRKFYDQFPDWNLLIIKSLENVLEKIKISDAQKKHILSIIVADRIKLITSDFVKFLSYDEAMARINNVISTFGKWLLPETISEDDYGNKKELFKAIKAKDSALIYSEQKKLLEQHRLKKFIKRYVGKVLMPVIERKRDGLIKFKT